MLCWYARSILPITPNQLLIIRIMIVLFCQDIDLIICTCKSLEINKPYEKPQGLSFLLRLFFYCALQPWVGQKSSTFIPGFASQILKNNMYLLLTFLKFENSNLEIFSKLRKNSNCKTKCHSITIATSNLSSSFAHTQLKFILCKLLFNQIHFIRL